MMAHEKQSAKKAVGVDGVTKEAYGENLIENIGDLVKRMKTFDYVPQPVRRAYIDKGNGNQRPLGIPAYEDKLVQGVMAKLLNDVYEPRFLDCSYGFRPGRKAHDVVRSISYLAYQGAFNYVLEADIRGFFDNLDQKWLVKFLEHDIADRNFVRYIVRFLKAGVMEEAELLASDKGTPQGGLISPVLANVYLHYTLDLWIEKRVRKLIAGRMYYLRYADDFLLMFQREEDARLVMEWLRERLAKFSLELAEEKTRILPFGKFKGTKATFDFLGFTFYNTVTRNGRYRPGVKTSAKKLKAKRKAVREWMWKRLNRPVGETLLTLSRKLVGHYNYYGINGNYHGVRAFWRYAKQRLFWTLRRRSQKHRLTWQRFGVLWKQFVKEPYLPVSIW